MKIVIPGKRRSSAERARFVKRDEWEKNVVEAGLYCLIDRSCDFEGLSGCGNVVHPYHIDLF